MERKLNRRNFLKLSSFSAMGLGTMASTGLNPLQAAPTDTNKPNILYIMTDQQRFDAIRRVQDELPDYKDKIKIRTPHLDRLSLSGAYFKRAYSQCPVCAPDRAVLRTGCTLERNGVQANDLYQEDVYNRMDQFKEKIEAAVSLDQILVEDYGYKARYFGKWHLPDRFYFKRNSPSTPAIEYNDFDDATGQWKLVNNESWSRKYQRHLAFTEAIGNYNPVYNSGDQEDTYSRLPYTPIQLDVRYGYPTNTPLKTENGFEDWQTSQPNVMGRFNLPEECTAVHYNGWLTVKAIDEMAKKNDPFIITASFHNPHAPMISAEKYLDYYWKNRSDLFVSPSIDDPMDNSAYGPVAQKYIDQGYTDPVKVKEWIACYYGMIEEIDVWVGKMLDKLDEHGITNNTLVVFTSDHGEMLGAHGLREKNKFLEESVHIPLFLSFPGKIPPKTIVDQPVSHLDLFSTVLDYAGKGSSDNSDGTSMRRFIEESSYNKDFDETAVVSEWDFRVPKNATEFDRSLGSETNFMILKDDDKLMMTKHGTSNRVDMMYNLTDDPYEMNNLVGDVGMNASDEVIGKAEHLKALLIEWMERMDGDAGYYSDSKYNLEGLGDIAEIKKRRKWKTLPIWVSDTKLQFGKSVLKNGQYIRNEYLYVGRTTSGTLNISGIKVLGDGHLVSIDKTSGSVASGNHLRIKVTLTASTKAIAENVNASIEITHNAGNKVVVPIVGCGMTHANAPKNVTGSDL